MQILGLVHVAIAVGIIYGWVMNILTLLVLDYSVITGELVVRIIGVFILPLGGVIGWL